jgi:hypothetical protein
VPIWSLTNSYFGKPYIWCMLHDFGGTRELFGDIERIAHEPLVRELSCLQCVFLPPVSFVH